MTPIGTPIERRLFYIPDGPIPMETIPPPLSPPSTNSKRRNSGRGQSSNSNGNISVTSGGHSIDTGMLQQDFALVSVDTILRGRVASSKGLGMLMSRWPSEVCLLFVSIIYHIKFSYCSRKKDFNNFYFFKISLLYKSFYNLVFGTYF